MNDTVLRHRLLSAPLEDLTAEARRLRDARGPERMTYSRKVFIPLTQLCRDVCRYCTFAKAPRRLASAYLSPDEVLQIARDGAAAGCKEALFTLGDKPELRYAAARTALEAMGFATTVDYLAHVAGRVLAETGLIPHINAGVLTADDYDRLRRVSGSMGLMLESASERLCMRGGAHFGSPDKQPVVRLASIDAAGAAAIPFTSGLLIGIGETRAERIDALILLRALHRRHGHLQEVIIQNFRAKPGTGMADWPEPSEEELLWTVAAARLVMPADVSVQTPPNLNVGRTAALIGAGLDDWGGISPVTIDHVNPEAPWPEIAALGAECGAAGRPLVERLTAHPRFVQDAARWLDTGVAKAVRKLADSEGLARDTTWSPGVAEAAPGSPNNPLGVLRLTPGPSAPSTTSWSPSPIRMGEELSASVDLSSSLACGGGGPRSGGGGAGLALDAILSRAVSSHTLTEAEIVGLFTARGAAAEIVVACADELRRSASGETVTYVVNRNINYTNICTYSCSFCAFSKTSAKAGLRDTPYDLPLEEIGSRVREAWAKGATEVCLQGGIHPRYTGDTYVAILRAVKAAQPGMHVHAFSPLEVSQGAATLGVPVADYLRRLKDEGLGSLPGTAAEILDDEVRAQICPDKLSTQGWLEVVGAAHQVGLPTTSTIMFGHLDRPEHWARHLLALRRQQFATGGFTEFVPLPFVHMASPVYLRGQARRGPTWRESVLMHAVARIVLHGAIGSIQASWVKLGLDGAAALLNAGVNDLGGVLMNESISRAAGAAHGQETTVADLQRAAASAGRPLRQRTTLYGEPRPRPEAVEAG
jgi:FO synthase